MDWNSRKVLALRLSNSMEADFCVEALKDAMAKHGPPEIMNTPSRDIACRDTLPRCGSGQPVQRPRLDERAVRDGVKISMDGRGRWIDNRMIERPWRSVKYECVYSNAFETGAEASTGIGRWIDS